MARTPRPSSVPRVLSYDTARNPLPVAIVPGPAPRASRAAGVPFDFTAAVRRLCEDIGGRCPDLGHIDVSRILFSITLARNGRGHGLQARVTPLRFRGGAAVSVHRGVAYRVQQFVHDGREALYVVTFCLPRFLNREFGDKMVTVFHELFHVSPAFDGDLRRHGGRYAVHTSSQKEYDRQMAELARAYLRTRPDPEVYGFLRLTHAELVARHGGVTGVFLPRPKLLPV